MTLEEREVRHVLNLAKLELSEVEVERVRNDLAAVLDYMERLSAVDVGDVPPMSRGGGDAMRLGADEPEGVDVRDAALEQAPETRDGYFVVPRVVGGEDAP
jgi:aspartyl-tRNA(Asn)/glutamyl-tRNA(Gln) amidotransferase subunit C